MVIQCQANAAHLLCHSLSLTPAPHPAPSNDGSTGKLGYNYHVTAAQSNCTSATSDLAVPSIQSSCADRTHDVTAARSDRNAATPTVAALFDQFVCGEHAP